MHGKGVRGQLIPASSLLKALEKMKRGAGSKQAEKAIQDVIDLLNSGCVTIGGLLHSFDLSKG